MEMIYKVDLGEVLVDDQGNVLKEFEKNLPHKREICEDFKKTLEKCKLARTFDGFLKNKIQRIYPVFITRDGVTSAYIHIVPISGFHWNERKRASLWEQLDAQMTDGFGECIDMQPIEGVEEHYLLCI